MTQAMVSLDFAEPVAPVTFRSSEVAIQEKGYYTSFVSRTDPDPACEPVNRPKLEVEN
jgi:hypothetical protein